MHGIENTDLYKPSLDKKLAIEKYHFGAPLKSYFNYAKSFQLQHGYYRVRITEGLIVSQSGSQKQPAKLKLNLT